MCPSGIAADLTIFDLISMAAILTLHSQIQESQETIHSTGDSLNTIWKFLSKYLVKTKVRT